MDGALSGGLGPLATAMNDARSYLIGIHVRLALL